MYMNLNEKKKKNCTCMSKRQLFAATSNDFDAAIESNECQLNARSTKFFFINFYIFSLSFIYIWL